MAGNPSSAVRFYSPEHPALAHTVRGKLEVRRAKLSAEITDGFSSDWPDYRQRVGVIKGIDEAIQCCIETENNLNGD